MKKYYLIEGVLYDEKGNEVVKVEKRELIFLHECPLRQMFEEKGHIASEDTVMVLL